MLLIPSSLPRLSGEPREQRGASARAGRRAKNLPETSSIPMAPPPWRFYRSGRILSPRGLSAYRGGGGARRGGGVAERALGVAWLLAWTQGGRRHGNRVALPARENRHASGTVAGPGDAKKIATLVICCFPWLFSRSKQPAKVSEF